MIEVKCNGKIYKFSEGSEIIDQLDMQAQDVADDDGYERPVPGEEPVYTHDVAAGIVELFEDLLESKDVSIPCADPDEQAELDGDPDNGARLYGTEYSDLLDNVEARLVEVMERVHAGAGIVKDVFSGTI